jgi:hypothetical protein
MSDWPPDDTAGIPTPDLVAAWLALNTLPTERVPLWAAHWIADGHDGSALVALAGLHGDDPHDVYDLLPQALAECGVPETVDTEQFLVAQQQAAAMTVFSRIAQLHLDGLASAYWVMQKVYEIVEPEFSEMITSLPLGQIHTLDDEWGAGWGRTSEELTEVVREACRAQLGLRPS